MLRVCGCTWRRISIFEHACVTFALCVQGSLEQIQSVLNSTEVGLHQLTALVDCRSLHMVSHFVCCVRRRETSSNPKNHSQQLTSLLYSPLLSSSLGLCSGINRPVLWWSWGSHLPGSLLLCHCSDVLFHCVQCATHLAWQEVTHAHTHTCSLSLTHVHK